MSHLIEEYAKSLGVKIGMPVLADHFYPIPCEKYITFHTNSQKVQAKHYDHWDIVFNLLSKKLKDNGIYVVQVGGDEDPEVKFCDYDTRGATFKQMANIIKNGILHLGIDSVPMHMASFYDKKIVALFANLYPENANPIWNKKNKYKLFSPDFSEVKPGFTAVDPKKRVNEIKPEDVSAATLDLLGINHNLNEYRTINIGKYHSNKIQEIVPNFLPDQNSFVDKLINLRFDYVESNDFIHHWLSRQCNVMFNKPIDISLINQYKENIHGMTIFLGDNDFDAEYFSYLTSMGLKFTLISRHTDKLPELRLKFFDHVIEHYKIYSKKDIDIKDDLCDNTYYHSNKTLISNNKKYNSKAAWKANIEKTSNAQKIIDNDDFWEELQHMNIYNYA
jgi:hypothetical protein